MEILLLFYKVSAVCEIFNSFSAKELIIYSVNFITWTSKAELSRIGAS